MFRQAVFGFLVLLLGAFPAGGEQLTHPLSSLDAAKVVNRGSIYAGRPVDRSCACGCTPHIELRALSKVVYKLIGAMQPPQNQSQSSYGLPRIEAGQVR